MTEVEKKEFNVAETFIPVTGRVAVAPYGTGVPTPEQGKSKKLTLNEEFVNLGLFTNDGGMEWTFESKGDPIEFFQQGYSIPSSEGSALLTCTLAQTSRKILEIVRGSKFDEHFHTVVDAAGNPLSFVVWVEEIAKNGDIRRRCGQNVKITSHKVAKSERGTVSGIEVTFKFEPAEGHPDGHMHEWFMTVKELAG